MLTRHHNNTIFLTVAHWYWVVKGANYNDRCDDASCQTRPVDSSVKYRVRCCSDEEIDGWAKKSGCEVWAETNIWGGCKKMNWDDAKAFCEQQSGRLCTKEELEDSCTEGTGCGYDYRMVWSSTQL